MKARAQAQARGGLDVEFVVKLGFLELDRAFPFAREIFLGSVSAMEDLASPFAICFVHFQFGLPILDLVVEQVEIQDRAELDDNFNEEFRKKCSTNLVLAIFLGSEDIDKKHESVENATTNKKADSDSKEEENDHFAKREASQTRREASTPDED
ncbi:hypothetical protein VNO80_11022 [Phaseolus coccineus]|uniref:Uncharacterized protein n=1 Tax=Phaseolus coccineus TaxID=3886 RepID=A0AAN9RF48_PHACN